MNWDAVGALSETIGALAVIISLIYLAIQIRAQTREARLQSSYQITEAFREAILSLQDVQRAKLTIKALENIEDLEDWERLQFNAISQRYLRVWEQAHYQFTEGHLDPQLWESIHESYIDLMGEPSIRAVWEVRKHAYRESFRDYVSGLTFRSYELR
jgi:hypothetical protein